MNFPIRPLLSEIEEIGHMGFDYVEITMDPPEATPQKISAQKKAILDLIHRYSLDVMGHLPTFVWTSDLYESLRKVSLQENLDALEAGAELGMTKWSSTQDTSPDLENSFSIPLNDTPWSRSRPS